MMRRRLKKNKKKYTILYIVPLLILIVVSVLFYRSVKVLEVSRFKSFTINYNALPSDDSLDNHNISVTDSSNKKQEINLRWDYNRNSIVVEAPLAGYKAGESYILNINDAATFTLSDTAKSNKTIKFKIKGEANSKKAISFKDKNLEQAVRSKINKEQGEILKSDLDSVTELVATFMEISDLNGIENLSNLHTLALDGNKIKDISSLKCLTELGYLGLSNNQISDISPIKKLSNLKFLSLLGNQIDNYTAIDEITKKLQWKDY